MATTFEHPRDLLHAVGQHLGRSEWFLIDQARVDQFADATNWPARMQREPLRAATVPEYLTLSLANLFLPQLVDVRGISMGVNIGCGNVRFPAPVPVEARIRGSGELVDASVEKNSVQAVIRITVELEGSDLLGCVVDTISRYYPV